MDLNAIRDEFGATHILRGSLTRDDDLIRVNIQLVDIGKSATIWADRLDGSIDDPLALEDELAQRIINRLAVNISPDEQTLLTRRHSSSPEALALYRQAFRLIMPPNDMERILAARHMFQRVVDMDPEFAGGCAGMSFSHSVTVLFFTAVEPDPELNMGIDFALKAIEIDPEFGMGYVTLAFAHAMSGRKDEALFNARRAIAVQPGDAITQVVFGLSHTLAGNSTGVVAALLEAMRLDPAEPRTPYRNLLATAYFMARDYSAAVKLLEENLSIGGPTGPHMDAFRAAAYAEMGRENEARAIIEGVIQSHAGFPVERWLARWHEDTEDLSRIMESLYRHGLPRK
jgi:tetratricopeptide (TPR) repeat protein